jgi:hypothetical protein
VVFVISGECWGSDAENQQKATDCYAYTDVSSNACYCTDNSLCFQYDLRHGDDCNTIFTTYTPNLRVSVALLVLIFVASITMTIITCTSCCTKPTQNIDPSTLNTHIVTNPTVMTHYPQDVYYSSDTVPTVTYAANPTGAYYNETYGVPQNVGQKPASAPPSEPEVVYAVAYVK